MKLRLMCLLSGTLLAVSTSAPASGPLTPQQCNSYPFVRTNGQATREDLMNELALLESVGYSPVSRDDAFYPKDIKSAEKRLYAKYRADCQAAHAAVQTPSQMQ
ncbi:DUF4148 domain-containing protein [Trinickia terrae]|uniref:DUF4148 domain-containing protein n=1 Tax=Trinickia terrae TaxID=2571161 RepID=A0A4U1I3Q8_9BURK|nr:DUF4148 domain-containing protein [Trinickia terrae]TKC87845.1 DUF4148 domain-containing protein [Trinickia terrae]